MVLSLSPTPSAMINDFDEAELEELEADMTKMNEFIEDFKGHFSQIDDRFDQIAGLLQTLVKSVDTLNHKVEQSFFNPSGFPIVQSVNYAQPLPESMPISIPGSNGDSIPDSVSTLAADDEVHQEEAVIGGSLYLTSLNSWISSEVQPYQQLALTNPNSNFTSLSSMQLDVQPLKETSRETVSFNPHQMIICNDYKGVEDAYSQNTDLIVEFHDIVPVPGSDGFNNLFYLLSLITGHGLDYYRINNYGLVHCVAFDPGIPSLPRLFKHYSLQTSQLFWLIASREFPCHGIKLSKFSVKWPKFCTDLIVSLIFDPGSITIIFCHVCLPTKLVFDTGRVKRDCFLYLVAEIYQLPFILACYCIGPVFSNIVFDSGDARTNESLRYVDAVIFPVELRRILLMGVVEMHSMCVVNCITDPSAILVEIPDSYLGVSTLLSPFLTNFDHGNDKGHWCFKFSPPILFLEANFAQALHIPWKRHYTAADLSRDPLMLKLSLSNLLTSNMTLCAILVGNQVLIIFFPFWDHNQICCMKLHLITIKMKHHYLEIQLFKENYETVLDDLTTFLTKGCGCIFADTLKHLEAYVHISNHIMLRFGKYEPKGLDISHSPLHFRMLQIFFNLGTLILLHPTMRSFFLIPRPARTCSSFHVAEIPKEMFTDCSAIALQVENYDVELVSQAECDYYMNERIIFALAAVSPLISQFICQKNESQQIQVTWVSPVNLQTKCPSFDLEDKVNVQEGSNVMSLKALGLERVSKEGPKQGGCLAETRIGDHRNIIRQSSNGKGVDEFSKVSLSHFYLLSGRHCPYDWISSFLLLFFYSMFSQFYHSGIMMLFSFYIVELMECI